MNTPSVKHQGKRQNLGMAHFGASQCISIDLDADATAATDAAARCVHTLNCH